MLEILKKSTIGNGQQRKDGHNNIHKPGGNKVSESKPESIGQKKKLYQGADMSEKEIRNAQQPQNTGAGIQEKCAYTKPENVL